MDIGARIRNARKSNGLTQEELGSRLGVSQAMIAAYESGKRHPKAETIVKIVGAIGCSVSEIVPDMTYHNEDGFFFFFDFEHEERLRSEKMLSFFNELNEDGQNEAVKRVSELAELEKYRKKDPVREDPAVEDPAGNDPTGE